MTGWGRDGGLARRVWAAMAVVTSLSRAVGRFGGTCTTSPQSRIPPVGVLFKRQVGRVLVAGLLLGAATVTSGPASASSAAAVVQATVLESALIGLFTPDRSEHRFALVVAYTSDAEGRVLVQVCENLPMPEGPGVDGPATSCENFESELGPGDLTANETGSKARLTTTVSGLGPVDLQFYSPSFSNIENDCGHFPAVRSHVTAFGYVVSDSAVFRSGKFGPYVIEGTDCGVSGTNLLTFITMA